MKIQITEQAEWDTELDFNSQTAEALAWYYDVTAAVTPETVSAETQSETANAPRMWDGSLPTRPLIQRYVTATHTITVTYTYNYPITHRAFMSRRIALVEITSNE